MRRSGVRIPLPPVFAGVVVESEDCRAVALAKVDSFDRATSTQRATTWQATAEEWKSSLSLAAVAESDG